MSAPTIDSMIAWCEEGICAFTKIMLEDKENRMDDIGILYGILKILRGHKEGENK